jgi:hypothetical protein
MMFAPLRTNLMAPLSTCCQGSRKGNLWSSLREGIHCESRCLKNSWSPAPFTKISMWSWLDAERDKNDLFIFVDTRKTKQNSSTKVPQGSPSHNAERVFLREDLLNVVFDVRVVLNELVPDALLN